ncbi:hypothetical protein H6G36_20020 [Anabaena minutissima FACHB-250]|nr:hypothetical protein [Anabaena minutissima FACHB-250]
MKLQKTQKSSKLEQASTLLNQIDDLHQVIGGVGQELIFYALSAYYNEEAFA